MKEMKLDFYIQKIIVFKSNWIQFILQHCKYTCIAHAKGVVKEEKCAIQSWY